MNKHNSSSHDETILDDAELDTVVAGASLIETVTAKRQIASLSSGAATVFGAMGMSQVA